jgi:hypothetical protein
MRNHLNKSDTAPRRLPATANPGLQEALARRERYLERHPHLRAYQAEIDRVLDKSGNSLGRMAVLGTLMQGKLLEMQSELYKLTQIVR